MRHHILAAVLWIALLSAKWLPGFLGSPQASQPQRASLPFGLRVLLSLPPPPLSFCECLFVVCVPLKLEDNLLVSWVPELKLRLPGLAVSTFSLSHQPSRKAYLVLVFFVVPERGL